MKSTVIENWFYSNEALFEGLENCKKYFELIEGEITEFKFSYDDLTLRFDFTVASNLSYRKSKYITIVFDRINKTLVSYYQKEAE